MIFFLSLSPSLSLPHTHTNAYHHCHIRYPYLWQLQINCQTQRAHSNVAKRPKTQFMHRKDTSSSVCMCVCVYIIAFPFYPQTISTNSDDACVFVAPFFYFIISLLCKSRFGSQFYALHTYIGNCHCPHCARKHQNYSTKHYETWNFHFFVCLWLYASHARFHCLFYILLLLANSTRMQNNQTGWVWSEW